MGKWLRLEALHIYNPKFGEAGHWGWMVTMACWCIAKANDIEDGDVTKFWNPQNIAKWCELGDVPKPMHRVKLGMQRALDADLIKIVNDRYVIHDWSVYQRSGSSADRVRKHRDRKKTFNNNGDLENDVTLHDVTCNVTETYVTPNKTVQDKTRQDKTDLISQNSTNSDLLAKSYSQEAYKITKKWIERSEYLQRNPKEKKKLLPKWLDAVDKLHRIDDHSWEEIDRLCSWIVQDTGDGRWSGWSKNCQSPLKLRQRNKDGLKYWDVIYEAMNRSKRNYKEETGTLFYEADPNE